MQAGETIAMILARHGLTAPISEFVTPTRTCQQAADALGCDVGQIAKSLIFKGKSSGLPVCVIASGTNRVCEKRLGSLLGEEIEKPDADFVRLHTGFVIGGIPPIGYTFTTQALLDEDLLRYEKIWAAAGTPHSMFALAPAELVRITQACVVRVKE
jgi:prolyl-tRNA editing enzyme YbaK/EbsC (Cys-tRNA(Pro) deacylase)